MTSYSGPRVSGLPATDLQEALRGRWPQVLQELAGLRGDQLCNRHQPCPLCGGRDRYRFDDQDGSGSWFCNQCGGKDRLGGGGSGLDLLMRLRGWSYRQACQELNRYVAAVGHRPQPHRTSIHGAGSAAIEPAARHARPWRQPERPPVDAPPPALDQGAIAQWCYRNADGEPLFWIQRLCPRGGGRKAFVHRVWLDGHWHRPSRGDGFSCEWPAPRPLYGLPGLSEWADAPVLVVEGEATADAAARLFPDQVVISWANGTNAIGKADWTPLAWRQVTLWPDADEPGRRAMQQLAQLLVPLGCQIHMVDLPADLHGGWDLADADWDQVQAARQLEAWAVPWESLQVPAPSDEDDNSPLLGPVAAHAPAPVRSESAAGKPFSCLGYDSDGCYYHSHRSGQVLRLARSAHTATHLVALAPLAYWETLYPGRMGVSWAAAASDLHVSAIAAGPFSPERIRGRGAWWDDGTPVLNLGDRLVTPAAEHPITAPFPSEFVYQRMPKLRGPGDVEPLSVADAAVVVGISNRFRWDVPASGTLLAGWVVLAPICGALRWRPHLWLTAGAGSGKSAILDRFVTPLLGDFALVVSGCTTEAGLRQAIGSDAVPVVFDEAESNERGDQLRMQAVLSLARVASSESSAELLKGTPGGEVNRYRVRSMFLLSSIATALKQGADLSRFAQLTLRNPADVPKAEREAHWAALDRDLGQITQELGQRLIARSVRLIPMIREAADVFTRASARYFDSQRLGDQVGTLLAGAWSLLSDVAPTEAEAELCVASHDWQSFSDATNQGDELLCLQTILQRQVRVEVPDRAITRTLGELVELAAHQDHDLEISADLAEQILGRHGLRVSEGQLLVSNTAKALAQCLADTPWGHCWPLVLGRLPGAVKAGTVRFRGAGMVTRALAIPLSAI